MATGLRESRKDALEDTGFRQGEALQGGSSFHAWAAEGKCDSGGGAQDAITEVNDTKEPFQEEGGAVKVRRAAPRQRQWGTAPMRILGKSANGVKIGEKKGSPIDGAFTEAVRKRKKKKKTSKRAAFGGTSALFCKKEFLEGSVVPGKEKRTGGPLTWKKEGGKDEKKVIPRMKGARGGVLKKTRTGGKGTYSKRCRLSDEKEGRAQGKRILCPQGGRETKKSIRKVRKNRSRKGEDGHIEGEKNRKPWAKEGKRGDIRKGKRESLREVARERGERGGRTRTRRKGGIAHNSA